MKIYYLGILRNNDDYGYKDGDTPKSVELAGEINYEAFGTSWTTRIYIQNNKHNIAPIIKEGAKIFAAQVKPNERKRIEQSMLNQPVIGHAYGRSDGFAAVLISDADYPVRAAQSALFKISSEFSDKYPRSEFMSARAAESPPLPLPALKQYVVEWQNPDKADSLSAIMKDLDETRDVLHKTIENVLDRGEKLDNLIEKSNNLSDGSRAFYKQSRKANSSWCCILM